MLISISGMVGSGKTTVASLLLDVMRETGRDAVCLRFQALPCFAFLRSPIRTARRSTGKAAVPRSDTPAERWIGYRRKRLTAIVALTYLARIVAFRIYRWSWRTERSYILNRYFYDLFVHYSLDRPPERFYLAVIRAILPVPDVSILVVAAPATIAQRRPHYSREYLSAVGDAYAQLQLRFHELVEIRTDAGANTIQQLERIVSERLNKRDAAAGQER